MSLILLTKYTQYRTSSCMQWVISPTSQHSTFEPCLWQIAQLSCRAAFRDNLININNEVLSGLFDLLSFYVGASSMLLHHYVVLATAYEGGQIWGTSTMQACACADLVLMRCRDTVRRGGSDRGVSRKRRAGGYSGRWSDDDDVADDHAVAPWHGRGGLSHLLLFGILLTQAM